MVDASGKPSTIPAAVADDNGAGLRESTPPEAPTAPAAPRVRAEPASTATETSRVVFLRPPGAIPTPAHRPPGQDPRAVSSTRGKNQGPAAPVEAPVGQASNLGETRPSTESRRVEHRHSAPNQGARPGDLVEVHIGRIEVVQPTPTAPAQPPPAPRAIGFDEYARARANGF
ncbi:MAG TPA: hypothetical protein VHQ03_11225 [Candidatus Dormibacteraeota bacterium]|nr:hypothetical protein [Candidatus Dormibacteraeota bacterium]